MSRAVVDAKEFSHAMSKISKILKKCAIPILEEVCLRIQNGRCTLTATDLETWLTAELPASGDDMFFVFRKTKDILRACSHFAGELTMEFSETRSGSKKAGKILLRCERRGAEFEVYDGADYLIKSSSQSPAVMERWVLKVQALEEKKRHYEGVLQRELDGLDDEFSVLKLLSQELQVRANSIRSQRFQQKAA